MIYTLVLITTAGLQSVGTYNNVDQCKAAAKDWQGQGVKAGCVQQESPEQAVKRMQALMVNMISQLPKE